MQDMNNLNCISYNVKGLGNPIKRKKILSQLKIMTLFNSNDPRDPPVRNRTPKMKKRMGGSGLQFFF